MPHCSNCGSWVSVDYARVNAVEGDVLACPQCPDRIPSSGHERGFAEVTGTRKSGEPTRYDPGYAADGGES